MKNKTNLAITIILGIILMSSLISAFAISIPPLPQDDEGNRILYILPGEQEEMTFVVQNGGGATNDISVVVEIIEGPGIIEITDRSNTYSIAAGGRVDVNTLITIPETAQIGDSYNIALSFITTPEGGGIALGSGIQQKLKVVVGETPAPSESDKINPPTSIGGEEKPSYNKTLIISLIIAIILIVIIISIIKRRR